MSLNQDSRILQSYNSDVISLMTRMPIEMQQTIDNHFTWS